MKRLFLLAIIGLIMGLNSYAQIENQELKDAFRRLRERQNAEQFKKQGYFPYYDVKEKPQFRGSDDARVFMDWVNDQSLKFCPPVKSEDGGILMKTLTLSFTVGKDGKVKDVTIDVSSKEDDFDKEAIRIVSSSTGWTPGRHDGENVDVRFTSFPVHFHAKGIKTVSSANTNMQGSSPNNSPSQFNAFSLSGTVWENIKYGSSYKDKTIEQLQFLDGERVRIATVMYLDDRLISEASDVWKYSVVNSSTVKTHFTDITERGGQVESFYEFKLKNDSGNYTLVDVTEHYSNHKEPFKLKSIKGGSNPISVRIVMPEAVDLGLSVKWASFNIGASKPEESGAFYAWGETESKQVFDWSKYKFGKPAENSYESNRFTKYMNFSGMEILLSEDDVAHIKLGSGWRMPTIEEFQELFDENNCNITYVDQNGIKGCRITSKKPGFVGNSIFIPAYGYYDGMTKKDDGRCCLWSSSRSGEAFAESLSVGSSGEFTKDFSYWAYGMPVRAVQGK